MKTAQFIKISGSAGGSTSDGVTRNDGSQGVGSAPSIERVERSLTPATTGAVGKGLMRESAGKPVPTPKTAQTLSKLLKRSQATTTDKPAQKKEVEKALDRAVAPPRPLKRAPFGLGEPAPHSVPTTSKALPKR